MTKVQSLRSLMRNNSLKFDDLNYVQRLGDGLNEAAAMTDRRQANEGISWMSTKGE